LKLDYQPLVETISFVLRFFRKVGSSPGVPLIVDDISVHKQHFAIDIGIGTV
jgi:hypothetical protein